MRIEEHWSNLRREAVGAQRRVDAAHPLDLYADFEKPNRPGLVLLCDERPNDAPSLKAISVERRQRADGRWLMRISLEEPKLLPVFAELCKDIIDYTRTGIDRNHGSAAVLSRIERWRNLMQPRSEGLSWSQLRGLVGELLVLERLLLPALGPDEAVRAWTGPFGAAQDFRLPDGLRLETKALDVNSETVQINGLDQLDAGNDPLHLLAVRLEDTGRDSEGALTPGLLVNRLREQLSGAPAASRDFEELLRFVGWDDAHEYKFPAARLARIDRHVIDQAFPRLTLSTVPAGVVEVSYTIALPRPLRADD